MSHATDNFFHCLSILTFHFHDKIAKGFLCILQINLRLILVSGKTKEFLFSPSDSAGDIAQTVFDRWPEGKEF